MLKYFKKSKNETGLRSQIVHVDHDRSHSSLDTGIKKSPSVSHLHDYPPRPDSRDSFHAYDEYDYRTSALPATDFHGHYESPAPAEGAYSPHRQPPRPPTASPSNLRRSHLPDEAYLTSPRQESFDDASSYHSFQSHPADGHPWSADQLQRHQVNRTYSAPTQVNPRHPGVAPVSSPLNPAAPLTDSNHSGRDPLALRGTPITSSLRPSSVVSAFAPQSSSSSSSHRTAAPTKEMRTAVAPLAETLKQKPEVDMNLSAEGEEFLKEAINYHEQGELEKATVYFRKAAEHQNPLGMFLFGMSLRHGWGCKANPNLAFQFLQKAAESAVFDLNHLNPMTSSAARGELAIAIYELGISFRHGWGVPKNKETAAYYFEIAANLGDADAQADLAFCYQHAAGVKKDMPKAAKYYRMAHAQGVEIFGNSWIFKSKYDNAQ
ncbi:hypothetical protein IWQ60_006248 [Tieghemiomyces parasiticus]|uniref:HCP-like protein n=1 Tax=Tieghemiomyces parasiticus TaxID=78921 RepID=A0A9W8AAA7_9FUNG|nr:hypothetical protein IWQ60_006248 [Tieghemiomyces parasiticus]